MSSVTTYLIRVLKKTNIFNFYYSWRIIMKKIISAVLVAVLALSNVAFADCTVNGAVDSTVTDKAGCDAKGGMWADSAAAATTSAAPAAKTN